MDEPQIRRWRTEAACAQRCGGADISRVLEQMLGDNLALVFENFLSREEVASAVASVYRARSVWTSGFSGEQFALGEVWYHYRETGATLASYQAQAEKSVETINSVLPWLYPRIFAFFRELLAPTPVKMRPGWCGPGIVIFPAGGRCAQVGGDAHYDWDGLEPAEVKDQGLAAYSFVSMLLKPHRGGGLTIWNVRHDPLREPDIERPDVENKPSILVDYAVGDLWMFRSMSAHRIQPFEGDTDRICLTFHILYRDAQWLVWF